LLIERQITQSDESVANFPDFRRLSSLHVRWTSLHDLFLLRPVFFARVRAVWGGGLWDQAARSILLVSGSVLEVHGHPRCRALGLLRIHVDAS
jgi:hypothetical protein